MGPNESQNQGLDDANNLLALTLARTLILTLTFIRKSVWPLTLTRSLILTLTLSLTLTLTLTLTGKSVCGKCGPKRASVGTRERKRICPDCLI